MIDRDGENQPQTGEHHLDKDPVLESGFSMNQKILTRLKLQQLRVLLEVARQESVSKAAEVLHIAQPAVTKTLREVEDLLGAKVFDRKPRGVVLNQTGRLILPHVHAVFAELNRIGDELRAFRDGLAGTIAAGATMVATPYLMPASLNRLAAANSRAQVRVLEGTISQMHRALDRGDVDLVLGRVLTGRSGSLLVQEILFDDPFVPVVGAAHELADKSMDSLSELSGYPWIMPTEDSSAHTPLVRYMLHHRIQPVRRFIETVSFQAILHLLGNSNMVAILPRHLASVAARGAVRVVGPELDGGSLPVGITYRRDHPLNPLGESLAEEFRTIAASVRRQHSVQS